MAPALCGCDYVERYGRGPDDTDDSADLFDRIAQANMSVTGSEFLRRWDSGEFEGVDWDSVPGLAEVATALPFARPAR